MTFARRPPSRRSVLQAACASLALLPVARGAPDGEDPDDDDLRRAFQRQPAPLRQEIVDWFALEARSLEGFYSDCTNLGLRLADRDRQAWPEVAPLSYYDPEVHAPGAARRRVLSEKSSQVRSARKRFFTGVPVRRLDSAWVYDYGTRELRRRANADSPDRIFANALAGHGPDHDLAEALIERALDDGSQAKVLGAFDHLYTTRDGLVYGGITLYDAWSSGEEIEMPDVDCLGILHEVRDDWQSYRAPVPSSQHDALYEEIELLFTVARRHRGLRQALARVHLRANAELADGYSPHLDRFHALWEVHASDPGALAEHLPPAADWQAWLEVEGKRIDTDLRTWESGQARKRALEEGAARVRQTLVWVMRELGAVPK